MSVITAKWSLRTPSAWKMNLRKEWELYKLLTIVLVLGSNRLKERSLKMQYIQTGVKVITGSVEFNNFLLSCETHLIKLLKAIDCYPTYFFQ